MIEGAWAIFVACFCFVASMAVPLFAQRWRTFFIVLAIAVIFFGWLTLDLPNPGSIAAGIGTFIAGLMLTGFAFGAIARFVMLVGRRNDRPPGP